MHHYQSNYSILEHAIFGICVYRGGCGNYVILYHANVFSVVDNIL